MSDRDLGRRFEGILTRIRQPARLIGEESGAGPGFSGDPNDLRVVLAFPDTYEIGISNQAIQILYHVARCTPGVGVERVYLPWVDVSSEMRRHEVPLLTLETWSPAVAADVMGITVQHEFDYTNVLEMLDLAGIPLHSDERTEAHPLVVVGGPACAGFLPLSRFVDAVVVGDGEEVFAELLETLRSVKLDGRGRGEAKRRLSTIAGVYVPGLSVTVERRVISNLRGAPYPAACLVPLTAGVHDRAWVEVMRGCTRGCRFCQAGMWYRPVRERPPDEVMRMAAAQLAATGRQELALGSLSTTDYSGLERVLMGMVADHPEARVSLPSLRVDGAAVRLARLASPTGPSLTLAPEAGSPRMWSIINKNVTADDVFAAAAEAFRAGRTTLKLYFIIGFPLEEDDDVAAIADLCLELRELGRRILGPRAGRLQFNVGVNNFIPKPFTPFQWAGMADRGALQRRQDLLRSRLRRPGIKMALHGIDKSYLEAALARGGEEMGDVIERAWRSGARFDSWTEQFRAAAWSEAFASVGTTAEELATTPIDCDRPLPWDVIRGMVGTGFLREEWERARRGETTPDCRWDSCSGCGICGGHVANDLVVDEGADDAGEAQEPQMPRAQAAPPGTPAVGECHRFVATFSVTGRGRFVGHLDRAEILRRAVRRAGGRLALSAGMRPKPLLSLALPLAVGVEGMEEFCEFRLAEKPPPAFAASLAACLPGHMQLLSLEPYLATRPLPARVVAAHYEVSVEGVPTGAEGTPAGGSLCSLLAEAAARFAAAQEFVVEEEREGTRRQIDVRGYVDTVTPTLEPGGACSISFRVKVTPTGTARPERVVEALATLAETRLETRRVRRMRLELA